MLLEKCRHRAGRMAAAMVCVVGAALIFGAGDAAAEDRVSGASGPLTYQVVASDAHLIREELGPPRAHVGGVPAEPVDAFCWDGEGVKEVPGELLIAVDPVSNTGTVTARWSDEHGDWTYTQTAFVHAHHPAGVRVGSSRDELEAELIDPVTTNVYLHGDTGAGPPVLPTVFAYLATWGHALVTLNGEPFVNPYGIPGPMWEGHVMVTDGARGADGVVRAEDGSVYSPAAGSSGHRDPSDVEAHLVFHDGRFPRTSNVPSMFSFFYHLNFESVAIEVRQMDRPGRVDR